MRQNLSVYLRRVKAGDSLDVTERGKTVARLVPAVQPDRPEWFQRLVDEGRIVPATRRIADLPPPAPARPGEPPLSELLDGLREDKV